MTIAPGFRPVPTILVLFLLTTLVYLSGVNTSLFLSINHLGSYLPDNLWAFLSYVGDGLTAVVIMLPLAWRFPRLLWAGFIALLIGTLSLTWIKDALYVARPPIVLPAGTFNLIGVPLTYLSFPSGHSATGMMFAVILMHFFQSRGWNRILLAWAFLIALSRIMVGAHWPADILGGAAMGVIIGWLSLYIAERWRWGETLWGQRVLVPFFIYASALMYNNEAGFPQFLCLSRLLALSLFAFGVYYWYSLWFDPKIITDKKNAPPQAGH